MIDDTMDKLATNTKNAKESNVINTLNKFVRVYNFPIIRWAHTTYQKEIIDGLPSQAMR